jgi:hypothetical protein
MFVDSEEPDRFYDSCPVCGKRGVIMPSYPIADACCPYCGNLILHKRVLRLHAFPYKMLPDTLENRREAQAVVDEQVRIWEEVKNHKRPDTLPME